MGRLIRLVLWAVIFVTAGVLYMLWHPQDDLPLPYEFKVREGESLRQIARELADQGALELALDTLKQQGLEYSLDPSAHGLAGVLLDALGREEEAVGRFRRALFLDPGHAESLAHLALLLEHLGRHHEATRLRKRLVEGGG